MKGLYLCYELWRLSFLFYKNTVLSNYGYLKALNMDRDSWEVNKYA